MPKTGVNYGRRKGWSVLLVKSGVPGGSSRSGMWCQVGIYILGRDTRLGDTRGTETKTVFWAPASTSSELLLWGPCPYLTTSQLLFSSIGLHQNLKLQVGTIKNLTHKHEDPSLSPSALQKTKKKPPTTARVWWCLSTIPKLKGWTQENILRALSQSTQSDTFQVQWDVLSQINKQINK